MVNVKMQQHQAGAALITSLVLMAVLTILSVSTLRSSMMDIRVNNIMKDRTNAFQCAEAALRQGEMWLADLTSRPDETTVTPVKSQQEVWRAVNLAAQGDITQQDQTWWEANGWAYVPDSTGADLQNSTDHQTGCSQIPHYIIEGLGQVTDSDDISFEARATKAWNFYRITAFSVGSSDSVNVVLQSTFAKPFN